MAIDTTRRRLASTMCCLASMSPRSMRLASAISRSAVSSGTRPIERRYSRSESSDGSTVRSSSGFLGTSGVPLTLALRAAAAASTFAASEWALRPSAPTTSMPCSDRYACSSRSCSFVTSTSSSAVWMSSNVRKPRSCPSVIRDPELVQLVDRSLVRQQHVVFDRSAPLGCLVRAPARPAPPPSSPLRRRGIDFVSDSTRNRASALVLEDRSVPSGHAAGRQRLPASTCRRSFPRCASACRASA